MDERSDIREEDPIGMDDDEVERAEEGSVLFSKTDLILYYTASIEAHSAFFQALCRLLASRTTKKTGLNRRRLEWIIADSCLIKKVIPSDITGQNLG